jgi:hypothetical protein
MSTRLAIVIVTVDLLGDKVAVNRSDSKPGCEEIDRHGTCHMRGNCDGSDQSNALGNRVVGRGWAKFWRVSVNFQLDKTSIDCDEVLPQIKPWTKRSRNASFDPQKGRNRDRTKTASNVNMKGEEKDAKRTLESLA